MFITTKDNLVYHLTHDLGFKKNNLVFMHSGLLGLGGLENGLETITGAFSEVLTEGVLVIPTFTYSWCKGEPYDPLKTECPNDVGSYSRNLSKDERFIRSSDPNFSVAALKNDYNGGIIEKLFDIGSSCFGKKSVFHNMYQLASERDGFIILLGGAHDDAVFRTTFIHYLEEKVGVPSRFLKRFYNPESKSNNEYVEQLVRFVSEEEYQFVTNKKNSRYSFPIVSDYSLLGEDLIKDNFILRKPFGYSETRIVNIKIFCEFLEKKLTQYPDYCVKMA